MLTGGKNVIPHAVRDVADAAAAFSARIGPDRHFDSQENVEEALAECCSPQNVTVIGMTGSGKSSTLDALAGERFCSRVSSEATLVRWQYRPHPAPHTHEWVLDLFYPSDALLNLEFWDTIGLEQEDAPRKLKHIVPKSDAILVVISARDGNQLPLWDYLRTLEERLHSRMVLVITHAELLSFDQLQSLKEELRSTSRERLGVQLPLYPVTTAGEQAGEGVEALRTCVQEVLKRSPLTDKRVERLLLATDRLLEEQGKVLNELHRLSKMDSGFLTSIDREIDRIQLQMEDEMPARLKADLEVYKERLGRSIYMPLKDFGIKPCLSKLFLDQEDVMRTEIKLMLILVILGALLGCFGEHAAGFACVAAALAVWVGGNLGLAWMQFRLSRQIVAAAAEMHIAVECGLRTPLYEAMVSGLSDYRKLYADIRGQVAGGVEHLQPLLNARYDLFYKLTVQKHRFRI